MFAIAPLATDSGHIAPSLTACHWSRNTRILMCASERWDDSDLVALAARQRPRTSR
jgi:hypothetical protein